MEIADFVRARKRRLLVVSLVPILAMAIAGFAVADTSEQYASTVSLDVLAPDSDAPNTAIQAATRLARLADSDAVVDATAAATDTSADDVRDAMSASVEGTTVEVRYATPDPADAASIGAAGGATAALGALYAPFIDEAQRRLQAADAADLAARQAVSDFETGTGIAPDPQGYRAVLNPQQVVEYERLQAAVARSNNRFDLAQRELDTLETRLNTVRSQVPGATSQVQLISLTTLVGRRLLTAAAVGLVVAALLLVIAELLWPVDGPSGEATLEPVPHDVAAGILRSRLEPGDYREVGVGSSSPRSVGERR